MVECKFYRYHPVTGQDAEDLSDIHDYFKTEKSLGELHILRENGATFWWTCYPEGNEIRRVERINMEFIILATGDVAEWITDKP